MSSTTSGHRSRHLWTTVVAVLVLALATVACGSDSGSSSSPSGNDSKPPCVPDPPERLSDDLPTPEVRTSENGVLETTLKASYSEVDVNGEKVKTVNYEGSIPAPTLVVCPGDTLIVHLENDLGDTPDDWMGDVPHEHDVPQDEGQLTNLHTHGFHVSPDGNSDNVFLSFKPGDTFTYEYHIPEDHPPGMYWYHPHRHGFVDTQIYGGMFGAIFVQGGLDTSEGFEDIPTRTLVVSSFEVKDGAVVPSQKATTTPFYLNGSLEPDIAIRPGEVQRWQILNADADAMINIGLEGHDFHVLANDGNTFEAASTDETLLMGPGERREVLVQGGPEGDYELTSLAFAQSQGAPTPAARLATVKSSGEATGDALPPLDALTPPQEDLRDANVATNHTVVYSERTDADGNTLFLFNGEIFDPDKVNEVMRLGEVAEWTLVNETTEWHTYHIHVNDFQVISVELVDVPNVSAGRVRDVSTGGIDPEDTVKIPPMATVVMRTLPTDFTGKFVYHCHMVFHEDGGMMGIVEVVNPEAG